MKPRRLLPATLSALVLAAWGGVGARAAEGTNAPAGTDYAAFRIIAERNIFSGNRSRRAPRAERENSRPARVDALALVGTMSYEKGSFAFFDGSSSDYRKTLKPDGTIADFKLLDIGTHGVKLDRKGKQLELRVGSQLRREDGGEWKISTDRDLPSVSSSQAPAATASSGTGAASSGDAASGGSGSPDGEKSDVLKRLLEQREKENR